MGFTKQVNVDFKLNNNQIVLSPAYIQANKAKFKKITGSRFGSILGHNGFVSPFKTWCLMTNIFVDVVDDTLMKAGTIIEPKIWKLACEKLGVNFKQYIPAQIKWDVFQENKIFGGIPDGEPVDSSGKLLYPDFPMLEIKTTSIDSFVYKKNKNDFILQKDELGNPIVKNVGEKRKKWFDAKGDIVIPEEYKFQLGLYCYLRGITHGVFAVGFLETSDYIDPNSCDINNREIRFVDFNVDLKEFKEYIDYAENWYKKYIEGGVSPEMTPEDIVWYQNEVN